MEHMTEEMAAAKLFEDCYDCAQTVFSHFAEELGLDEETALKISAGFGGGMHKGDMCGTVTGGLMALGLKYGFCEPKDAVGKDIMNKKAQEYERRVFEGSSASAPPSPRPSPPASASPSGTGALAGGGSGAAIPPCSCPPPSSCCWPPWPPS